MAAGLLTLGFALHSMSDWTPDVSQNQMILTFMMQGFAIGFVFNPMTVMAFTTLPPALRGYATSLQSLCRNLGQAVGVSVTSLMLVRSEQTSHADIAGGITPFDRVLQGNDSVSHMLDPATRHGAAMLDGMINHQAQIIAFNNDFRMMSVRGGAASAAAAADAQARTSAGGGECASGGGLKAAALCRPGRQADGAGNVLLG